MRNETEASIEREQRSVTAAIDLVASGQASRVSLGGLKLADLLVGEARRYAATRGVRIREIWPLGDGSPDLVVEAESIDA